MTTRKEVYNVIDGEIEYAQALGSDRVESHERPHTTGEYLTMLATYFHEAQESWTRVAGDEKALHSVRKIAAIAVRCMEDNGALRR